MRFAAIGLDHRHIYDLTEGLVEAGATFAWRTDNQLGQVIILRDPEGNEFCVC